MVSGNKIYLLSLIVIEIVEVCVQKSACFFVSWGTVPLCYARNLVFKVCGLLPHVVDELSASLSASSSLINSKV